MYGPLPGSRRLQPLTNRFVPFVALLALLLLLSPLQHSPDLSFLPPTSHETGAVPDYGTLPLTFVPNTGQTDPSVRFHASWDGGTLFFTPREVVLALPTENSSTGDQKLVPSDMHVLAPDSSVVRLSFDGSNQVPVVRAMEELSGRVNYLVGKDPSRWRTDLPTYGGIEYQQLYPGVDLVYTGIGRTLKGTYAVAPAANPAVIRWRYVGATGVTRDARTGDLAITLPSNATLTERAPTAWQVIGNERVPVAVQFDVASDASVGFTLGAYDVSQPLTIDPFLSYSTLIGGGGADEGRDVAVDQAGNAYITGSTLSAEFPGAGPPQAQYRGPTTAANFGDAFVAKLNPSGTGLVYATYLGGGLQDVADAITVDGAGNVYITGSTESTDFPVLNALQPNLGGQNCSAPPCGDAFVAKLNAAGNALVFSTYLGGSRDENTRLLDVGTRQSALGIAVDSAANVYVTGSTNSPDFPTVNAAFTDNDGSFDDIFVAKLRPDGRQLLYSTYLGGTGVDSSGDITADNAGNAYVTGFTLASNFPTKSAYQSNTASAGQADAVVTKLDTTASGAASVVYSTYLGGGAEDYGMEIEVDGSGQAVIAGHTASLNFPTRNPLQATNASAGDPIPRDAFITKLNAAGNSLLYSTYLGGGDYDVAYGMDVGPQGTIFVTGRTSSDDFPTKEPWQAQRNDFTDVFVARLDPTQSGAASLLYSTFLGGTGADFSYGVAVDPAGAAYVTGITSGVASNTFPIRTTIGPNGSGSGILVAKLDPSSLQRIYLPLIHR